MQNYILALIFCKITKWPQKLFLLQINPKSNFKHSNHANLSFWFNFGKLPNWSSKFVKFTFWSLYAIFIQNCPKFIFMLNNQSNNLAKVNNQHHKINFHILSQRHENCKLIPILFSI